MKGWATVERSKVARLKACLQRDILLLDKEEEASNWSLEKRNERAELKVKLAGILRGRRESNQIER